MNMDYWGRMEGGGEAGNIDRCGRVSLMVKINGMNIEGKHSEK